MYGIRDYVRVPVGTKYSYFKMKVAEYALNLTSQKHQRDIQYTAKNIKDLYQTLLLEYSFEVPQVRKVNHYIVSEDGQNRSYGFREICHAPWKYKDYTVYDEQCLDAVQEMFNESGHASVNIRNILFKSMKTWRPIPDELIMNGYDKCSKMANSIAAVYTQEVMSKLPCSYLNDCQIKKVRYLINNVLKERTYDNGIGQLDIMIEVFNGTEKEAYENFLRRNSMVKPLSSFERAKATGNTCMMYVDNSEIIDSVAEKYKKRMEKSGMCIYDFSEESLRKNKEVGVNDFYTAIGMMISKHAKTFSLAPSSKSTDGFEIVPCLVTGTFMVSGMTDMQKNELFTKSEEILCSASKGNIKAFINSLISVADMLDRAIKPYFTMPDGRPAYNFPKFQFDYVFVNAYLSLYDVNKNLSM